MQSTSSSSSPRPSQAREPSCSRSPSSAPSGVPSIRRSCSRRPSQTCIPSRWPPSASAASSSCAPGCAAAGRRWWRSVGGAGGAPVAVEARADERFVGQVVSHEHGGDPLEERGFGQGAGRGQQAEHGPFDAICEGRGGRFAVPRSPSHQRPGSISTRRCCVGRASSPSINAMSRSTGSGASSPVRATSVRDRRRSGAWFRFLARRRVARRAAAVATGFGGLVRRRAGSGFDGSASPETVVV